jgi:hypothetical protein
VLTILDLAEIWKIKKAIKRPSINTNQQELRLPLILLGFLSLFANSVSTKAATGANRTDATYSRPIADFPDFFAPF